MRVMQKILRPVLNFLIERYFPRGAFFGNEYLTAFDGDMGLAEKWGSVEMACSMLITSRVRELGGTHATFEATDIEHSGVQVGTWRLTVDRVSTPIPQHSK